MIKRAWPVIVLLILFMMPVPASAQGCAVCTKTASELGPKGARGLNGGILYLAFLPLVILGSVGYMWWRREKHIA